MPGGRGHVVGLPRAFPATAAVVAGRARRRDRGSGNYHAGMTLPGPTGAYRYGVSAWGRLRGTPRRHPFGTDATGAAVLCAVTLLVAPMNPALRGRPPLAAAGR